MNEQLALIEEALRRSRAASLGGMPLDIAVARQYGDSTVTLRTQLPAKAAPPVAHPGVGRRGTPDEGNAGIHTLASITGSAPRVPHTRSGVDRYLSTASFFEAGIREGDEEGGVGRQHTSGSFYDDASQVGTLLAEIERLKRKALSRGVNLTSPQEDVPAEDVAMLRQVFIMADSTGNGHINLEELKNLHHVLGEPLTDEEAASAFKAMDSNRSGDISFDDFLAWYTLAHSSSGMLSKKGQAYTDRFKRIMGRIGDAFDAKNLSISASGQPRSLEYRVNFFYNDRGVLKQISPW